MVNASWALQQAMLTALTSDSALVALLGGTHVWDSVPARAPFPYVAFAGATERDWSTGTDQGSEHAVTLHVWSRYAGRKEAQAIITAVRDVLHEAELSVSGHALINLRHESSEIVRHSDGETYQGIMRLRAVTEPR
ncbi:DUF3168 domain-containing protein [Hyphomicrobium sulfonivorans]|uniref:DUF3168 domain-containing protein n=1 Tax=Hyphomicrobium sulfonivorans TaxID=121290 RepID=UPI00156FE7EA|nr:DUF3168 domain-containing protein [Hyphomicrobium sulfonivorans]MBI1650830.1 DUF3168 domain-containing protein [Hyphomicrobium sulfonivorans]NSL71814.1 DUF3168 domain-containing protein [Hyphomicrobium sulfonivorans]